MSDWTQIRPDILSGQSGVQTVCISYKQTTLVDNRVIERELYKVIICIFYISLAPESPSLSSEESYAELPTLDKSEETASNDGAESTHLQDHINMTYKQVKKLIQLHSQLVTEPKLLQEKYENLKDLGEDVSDSIADLKRAAENIAKKP